jgi:hypothetical protein
MCDANPVDAPVESRAMGAEAIAFSIGNRGRAGMMEVLH